MQSLNDNSLHTKYRPRSFEDLIGHTKVVTQLKGMVKSGKVPGAILFTGPSSVGKTTLARALASEVNGVDAAQQVDLAEINAAEQRTIDDMRELIRQSKFMPRGKFKFIIIDEAQQLLSNATAAQAILKPLEEAGKTRTVWVLCSMDPSKFKSATGKAIANRCVQFALQPHTHEDLLKQGIKICRGEGIKISKTTLQKVVEASNYEMRTLANLLQGVRDFIQGGGTVDEGTIVEVLSNADAGDDERVLRVVKGIVEGHYAEVHKTLLDVAEPFQFLNKLIYASHFLLSNAALNGAKHPKVWFTDLNRKLLAATRGASLGVYAKLHESFVNTKIQAGTFGVSETDLLTTRLFRLIHELHKSVG